MKKITLFLIMLSVAILSACAPQPTVAPGGGLAGTSWRLTSYGPVSAQQPAVSGVETNLDFGTDGKVGGKLGCNSIGGDYSVTGQTVTFESIFSTLMACDEPQMTQESTALQVLQGAASFVLAGQAADTLMITSEDGKNMLTFAETTNK